MSVVHGVKQYSEDVRPAATSWSCAVPVAQVTWSLDTRLTQGKHSLWSDYRGASVLTSTGIIEYQTVWLISLAQKLTKEQKAAYFCLEPWPGSQQGGQQLHLSSIVATRN